MIKYSSGNKNKATDKKQKYTDAKLDKIEKWMGNLMDNFDNTSPNRVEEKNPQYYGTLVQKTGKLHQYKLKIIIKQVEYGLWNMIPIHQNSMKLSTIPIWKYTLLFISITSTTTYICVSMKWQ